MKYVALTVALLGAAGLYVGAKVLRQDPAGQASGWEVRVFVIDKTTLKSVDLSDWSAQFEIEPRGGKEQKVPMEKAATRKEADPDRDGGKPAEPGVKPEAPNVEPKAEPAAKPMVCGQVKDMDRYYVELVVVNMSWKGVGRGAEGHGHDVQAQKGYAHDHGGSYFKTHLARGWWTDAKQNAIAFDADVHFTYGADKKSVKGFSYPFGLYKDVLQKVMDEDLKQARDHVRSQDPAKWKEVGGRIMAKTHALPPLGFKKDSDREEFERARRECMAACQLLMNAATPEQAAEAINQCKDKCDNYQDESQDAEGVPWEHKGHDTKGEQKPLDKPSDTRK